MKIAIIGYGRMGKEIERIALSRGHQIVLTIDIHNLDEFIVENLTKADVAIVFTVPESAVTSFSICFDSKIPVVSGTTGWLDKWDEVVEKCRENDTAFFYASNFSLGVNIFFELNKYLSKLLGPFEQYKPKLTEVHHTRKLDAPSGTAISLAEGLIQNNQRLVKWSMEPPVKNNELEIESVREGDVPGIHAIKYDSPVDFIEITHSAKSREGFAFGAVLAAEFVLGKKGIFSMKDLMKFE
ncbi:MAG: 4-hydroxy-tetrahydrodipicolinate reductase [Prolixibacteraceae bacterium]|nr:4-hydroxy-tetrahydrodipicolinate reductase [Prolixibacteraceae bacterium]